VNDGKHISKFFIPVFIGMFFLFACGNSNEDIDAFAKKEKLPQLISTKIIIEYSDSARLKARIKAPVLKEYGQPENYTVLPKGVDIYFYDIRGNVTSTMHADSAIIRRNSDLMEAYRNVKVVNENGEMLETQELFWRNAQNPADRQLYTYSFVTITKGGEVLYGDGLTANESFSKYRIGMPQGTMNMKDGSGTP
jgi:LPS export ABC transporter protein LptC